MQPETFIFHMENDSTAWWLNNTVQHAHKSVTAAWWRFSFKKSSRFLWDTLMEMRKKQCVFLFTKDWRVIYGLWEVSRAWLGLMQSILIFITPTSCAYDILDLPWYAKSSLSLLLSLTPILPLPLPLSIVSLALSLDAPSIELKGHITLTACVNSVSSSISLSAGRRSRKICQGQCEEAMALPHLAKVMLWEHKNGFVNIFMYQGSHGSSI